jgi:hypothetical protein
MTEDDYARKLDELDRLLNDPDVPMQPARIWSLLAELSQHDVRSEAVPRTLSAGAGLGAGPLNRSAE